MTDTNKITIPFELIKKTLDVLYKHQFSSCGNYNHDDVMDVHSELNAIIKAHDKSLRVIAKSNDRDHRPNSVVFFAGWRRSNKIQLIFGPVNRLVGKCNA